MDTLKNRRVVVTGGSRGLGLGVVEALVKRGALVTVVARQCAALEKVAGRLGVALLAGDITDSEFARATIRNVNPEVLILNAGATPTMAPIQRISWEDFSGVWETDVKAALYWIQAALQLPLPRGSRVLLASSGAAISGSPLSGGYAGAKRMMWLMAGYANGASDGMSLGIRFQAILPNQIIGGTGVGDVAAAAYAKAKGVELKSFLASFGRALEPALYGELVVELLTNPSLESATAFAASGDSGLVPL